jgi:hypothetical protein
MKEGIVLWYINERVAGRQVADTHFEAPHRVETYPVLGTAAASRARTAGICEIVRCYSKLSAFLKSSHNLGDEYC